MPSEIIYNCNYYSLDTAAKYFIVSKSALWQRLNNMKRLDLLHAKTVQACTVCGNTYFSPFAEFCGICGQSIRDGLKGVRRLYYPQVKPMDKYRRVEYCPKCNKTIGAVSKDTCSKCGTYVFNFCGGYSDGDMDKCSYTNLGSSRFCEMCGKPTYYTMLKGF
jgi:hypothetical protein